MNDGFYETILFDIYDTSLYISDNEYIFDFVSTMNLTKEGRNKIVTRLI